METTFKGCHRTNSNLRRHQQQAKVTVVQDGTSTWSFLKIFHSVATYAKAIPSQCYSEHEKRP